MRHTDGPAGNCAGALFVRACPSLALGHTGVKKKTMFVDLWHTSTPENFAQGRGGKVWGNGRERNYLQTSSSEIPQECRSQFRRLEGRPEAH